MELPFTELGIISRGTEERIGQNPEFGFGYIKFEMSIRQTCSEFGKWATAHPCMGCLVEVYFGVIILKTVIK